MPLKYKTFSSRLFNAISIWLLPLGLLVLLAGIPIIPDRSMYSKAYYWLIVGPAIIALCLRPKMILEGLREPLVAALLVFSLWACASIAWSDSDTDTFSLIKRPVYILLLYYGCALITTGSRRILPGIWLISAVIVLLPILSALFPFLAHREVTDRFIGTGGMYNPLIGSHIFGFFLTYWLACALLAKGRVLLAAAMLFGVLMFIAVLATGSRTPLVGITLAVLWFCFLCRSRRALLGVVALALILATLLVLFPDTLLNRGMSYRFDLWQYSLEKIVQRPWTGYGLDAAFRYDGALIDQAHTLREPHSFILSVIYIFGFIGLMPWIFMHGWALWSSWKNRTDPRYIIASGWLVFGIGAGLTEGAGIFSRPKEHWFLVWIPLALIAALNIEKALRQASDKNKPAAERPEDSTRHKNTDEQLIGFAARILPRSVSSEAEKTRDA